MLIHLRFVLGLLLLSSASAVDANGELSVSSKTSSERILASEVQQKGWIVYCARSEAGDWDLFVCRPDGSASRTITATKNYNEAAPQFSRDGRKLLYRRLGRTETIEGNRYGEQGELVLANSDGTQARVVGGPGEFPWASWSPDGSQLARLSIKGISFVDIESREIVRRLPRHGFFQQMTWSPDGEWLSGVANSYGTGWSVARMNAVTGETEAINRVDCCTPDWFPDSRRVVFSWRPPGQKENHGQGWTQLWMADADGKSRRLLYGEDGRHIYGGHVSPDAQYVLFTGNMREDGDPQNAGAPMGLLRMADAPIVTGESRELRALHPAAKSGPVLTLPIGWEPSWTEREIFVENAIGAADRAVTRQTAAALVPNVRSKSSRVPRSSIDLSGEWEFQIDPQDEGREKHWFDSAIRFKSKIIVPGAWNAQGAEFPSEQLLRDYEKKFLNGRNLPGAERESEKLFHVFPGPAWCRKTVRIPAEWNGRIPWLVFGGVHREAAVWIDGNLAASHHSYLTPFRINLSKQARAGEQITIAVRVDARRRPEVDPLMGCLDTLDFLYLSWGGLHRKVTLEATPPTWIEEVFVRPRLSDETAELHVALSGSDHQSMTVVAEIVDANGRAVAHSQGTAGSAGIETILEAQLPGAKLWSPKTPHLYTAEVRLVSDGNTIDTRTVRFGMREFQIVGGKFLLNGKPIFLRGYGDDCIFPNSICPPADKASLRQRLAAAREYGFNYVRHHSWIPTEEYLDAADELGMMLQPEFPFAYSWDLPKTPEAKRLALEEWSRVIRLNRNHPSIVTWCMGNEQYGSFDLAPEMYRTAKRLDPTRPVIDSDGCGFNNRGRETLDFLVVQFGEGNSIGFGDGKYDFPADIKKPVVAHEMGYFVTLPDLRQLSLFENGVRPYWLIQTRELAARRQLLDVYPSWLAASYKLQAACLKSNLEAARGSRLSGTSVWLFQDYPNCAEGVVDMFFRPKAFAPQEFRKFNSPTVLLLDSPGRNFPAGRIVSVKFLVSRYEDEPSDSATLKWALRAGNEIISSGEHSNLRIRSDGVQELAGFVLKMPETDRAKKLVLSAELIDANGHCENSWNVWVIPRHGPPDTSRRIRWHRLDSLAKAFGTPPDDAAKPSLTDTALLVTDRLDAETMEYLEAGGRAFLLNPEPVFPTEKTNFRLSSWDGGGPSGTIMDPRHPALREVATDNWCDLQFYSVIQGSKTVLLDSLPANISPIIRCIDRPNRLANRAYLFEAAVGKGKLLVSGFNFAHVTDADDPAARFLLDRLIAYALGPQFAPETSLPRSIFP